jgi:sugar lactone lactonase YvrE
MTDPHDSREDQLRGWLRDPRAADELWRSAVDDGLRRTERIPQRRPRRPGWRSTDWRWLVPASVATGLVVIALAMGGLAERALPGASPGSSAGAFPPPAQRLDGHIAASATVPVAEPVSARMAAGALWVATLGGTVYRMDPGSGALQGEIELAGNACGPITQAAGLLWLRVCLSGPVADGSATQVVGIDPAADAIVHTVVFGTRSGGSVAELDGSVWAIADERAGVLVPINPATGEVGTEVALHMRISDMVAAAGALWLVDAETGTIVRVDPAGSDVPQRLSLGDRPTRLLARSGALWVGLGGGDLVRVDPAHGTVADRIRLGSDSPVELVDTGTQLIVLTRAEIAFVDVAAATVVRRVEVGSHAIAFAPQFEGPNHGLAADGSTVWFVPPHGEMVRLAP